MIHEVGHEMLEQVLVLGPSRWLAPVRPAKATAIRDAIEEVFGSGQLVKRCRNHKVRNVVDECPKEQHGQALNLIGWGW